MKKITIGDKVKVINGDIPSQENFIGQIGKVTDIPTKNNILDYIHVEFKNGKSQCFDGHQLKLIGNIGRPKKEKLVKKYVVSSSEFKSIEEIERYLEDLHIDHRLDRNAKVYEVIGEYQPKLKLVKVKE